MRNLYLDDLSRKNDKGGRIAGNGMDTSIGRASSRTQHHHLPQLRKGLELSGRLSRFCPELCGEPVPGEACTTSNKPLDM